MISDDATNLLKAEQYLRFHDLCAGPSYDALTVQVDGAEVSDHEEPAGTGDAEVDRILGPVRAIETGPGCLRYTVVFADCVAYSWRDESYAVQEDEEDDSPTMLRHYTASAFLDYVRASTFAEEAAGFPLQHFALVTLDAVIDVVCAEPPEVTAEMLDPDDPGPLPERPGGRSTSL